MRIFFDTSALAKRYIQEPGSEQVVQICQSADKMVVSFICLPELISTLNRLIREGKLAEHDYQEVRTTIFKELGEMEICQLSSESLCHTIDALEKHPLRAMDAIHLGCACTVEPDLFVSADNRQLEAAEKLGLCIERI